MIGRFRQKFASGLELGGENLGDEGFQLRTWENGDDRCVILHAVTPQAIKHACQEHRTGLLVSSTALVPPGADGVQLDAKNGVCSPTSSGCSRTHPLLPSRLCFSPVHG